MQEMSALTRGSHAGIGLPMDTQSVVTIEDDEFEAILEAIRDHLEHTEETLQDALQRHDTLQHQHQHQLHHGDEHQTPRGHSPSSPSSSVRAATRQLATLSRDKVMGLPPHVIEAALHRVSRAERARGGSAGARRIDNRNAAFIQRIRERQRANAAATRARLQLEVDLPSEDRADEILAERADAVADAKEAYATALRAKVARQRKQQREREEAQARKEEAARARVLRAAQQKQQNTHVVEDQRRQQAETEQAMASYLNQLPKSQFYRDIQQEHESRQRVTRIMGSLKKTGTTNLYNNNNGGSGSNNHHHHDSPALRRNVGVTRSTPNLHGPPVNVSSVPPSPSFSEEGDGDIDSGDGDDRGGASAGNDTSPVNSWALTGVEQAAHRRALQRQQTKGRSTSTPTNNANTSVSSDGSSPYPPKGSKGRRNSSSVSPRAVRRTGAHDHGSATAHGSSKATPLGRSAHTQSLHDGRHGNTHQQQHLQHQHGSVAGSNGRRRGLHRRRATVSDLLSLVEEKEGSGTPAAGAPSQRRTRGRARADSTKAEVTSRLNAEYRTLEDWQQRPDLKVMRTIFGTDTDTQLREQQRRQQLQREQERRLARRAAKRKELKDRILSMAHEALMQLDEQERLARAMGDMDFNMDVSGDAQSYTASFLEESLRNGLGRLQKVEGEMQAMVALASGKGSAANSQSGADGSGSDGGDGRGRQTAARRRWSRAVAKARRMRRGSKMGNTTHTSTSSSGANGDGNGAGTGATAAPRAARRPLRRSTTLLAKPMPVEVGTRRLPTPYRNPEHAGQQDGGRDCGSDGGVEQGKGDAGTTTRDGAEGADGEEAAEAAVAAQVGVLHEAQQDEQQQQQQQQQVQVHHHVHSEHDFAHDDQQEAMSVSASSS
ncbi:hypothetical protein PTSG_02969 [Salpingoeca rosetta]|uniref:Uncharacterized protein n=1 Tax=Salpingoeca rosetta (strain ATCC 50818 / BSB-021) TaxID=946362 RepID=F2U3V7_SALR5|nr:uncharacterized protein PTSG_02969 [Salpingoeca rosetta]EGD82301.1 hypothetical protein PTSG_02969 [Salpingoeca rosetta]|eukprot:XP_004996484.1 hypothetical protein PTSG_02969 [Salpingoeca rosetta]